LSDWALTADAGTAVMTTDGKRYVYMRGLAYNQAFYNRLIRGLVVNQFLKDYLNKAAT